MIPYLAAAAVAYAGYRAGALSVGGAVAACVVGGTIFGFGGLAWAALLVIFFASSSALSFFKAADTRKVRAAETFEKGGKRDAAQVIANGGAASLAALLTAFVQPSMLPLLFGAFLGALGTAMADTWATEIGVLSNSAPRLIAGGRPVAPGTSGGVTRLGTAAAAAGALCLGLAAAAFAALSLPPGYPAPLVALAAALAGGMAGALFDSLLGATVQASYRCPRCDKPTESPIHRCGTQALLVHGNPRVNNDLVNLLATVAGAITAGGVWWLLSR
jgi:uncharacterized protein (TIGR00297 family)